MTARAYRQRRPVPGLPEQPALALSGPSTCSRCGRDLAPVVVGGRLDLGALTALGLEGFNAALRCWFGRCCRG